MASRQESKDLMKCENRTKGRLTRGRKASPVWCGVGGGVQSGILSSASPRWTELRGQDSGAEDFTKGAYIQGVVESVEVACLWRSGCVINSLW